MSKPLLSRNNEGFTLIELVVAIAVLAILSVGVLGLLSSLVFSANLTKRKAVAMTLAVNQMEYLKSLPYDSLAVAGGAIYSASPLPASYTKTINGLTYTIYTSINYVDDAFDGCSSYPSQALKEKYCRNYPPPSGAPATDTNPADYKIIHVYVNTPKYAPLATVDTEIAARVAETASTTGALFVNVIDGNGNPVSGATVQVINTTVNPNLNLSDTTDSAGTAIFYGLTPDNNGFDYNITASKTGYSTLSTIPPSGSLQPYYPNKQILSQQSTLATMVIMPMGSPSLLAEVYNTSGSPINNAKIYIKGGYKKYNNTSNTAYYYDNLSPSDGRPVSDASGNFIVNDLVPGNYLFCGDNGSTSCAVGTTTYYLAAAVPYGGNNSLMPITIPTFTSGSTQATFSYNAINYLQKVRLILTNSSNFPRVFTISPDDLSVAAGGLSSFGFNITGVNLPCSANPASCNTSVKINQAGDIRTASCTGASSGLTINCTVNLSGIAVGMATLSVTANSQTLNLPGSPLLGGLNVSP